MVCTGCFFLADSTGANRDHCILHIQVMQKKTPNPIIYQPGAKKALGTDPGTDIGTLTFGKSIHLSTHLWQSHLVGAFPTLEQCEVSILLKTRLKRREGFKFPFLTSMLCFSSRTERTPFTYNEEKRVLKADAYEGRQNHFSQSCRRALPSSPNQAQKPHRTSHTTLQLLSCPSVAYLAAQALAWQLTANTHARRRCAGYGLGL